LTALHGWLLAVLNSPLQQLQGKDPRCSMHGGTIVEAALQKETFAAGFKQQLPMFARRFEVTR